MSEKQVFNVYLRVIGGKGKLYACICVYLRGDMAGEGDRVTPDVWILRGLSTHSNSQQAKIALWPQRNFPMLWIVNPPMKVHIWSLFSSCLAAHTMQSFHRSTQENNKYEFDTIAHI